MTLEKEKRRRAGRRSNGSGPNRGQYTRNRVLRKAWRPIVEPRGFRETRREFDAQMRSTGRAVLAAWAIGVLAMVAGMWFFGWGC